MLGSARVLARPKLCLISGVSKFACVALPCLFHGSAPTRFKESNAWSAQRVLSTSMLQCLGWIPVGKELHRHKVTVAIKLLARGFALFDIFAELAVGQNRFGIPSWGFRCTTHFSTFFGGDWDVHQGLLTHGNLGVDVAREMA